MALHKGSNRQMTFVDHLKGIWGISLCIWGILYLYAIITIKRFIIDRYENETGLLETDFLQNHTPFVRYFPDFFSAGFYGTHLAICLLGWRIFGSRKVFKDIADPNSVAQYFSEKENWRVAWEIFCEPILFFHVLSYYLFRYLYPDE